MSQKIYAIGTIILDIVFKNSVACNSNAGGSVFNSVVSLHRLGADVKIITAIAKDLVGDILNDFATKTVGLDEQYIVRFDGESRAAMAFIDDATKQTKYQFYGDVQLKAITGNLPILVPGDILFVGCSISYNPFFCQIIQRLNVAAALVYYDPNIRNQLNDQQKQVLNTNINVTDILRLSTDDLAEITSKSKEDFIKTFDNIHVCIITDFDVVHYYCQKQFYQYKFEKITPVNTIGAGDSFNAGFLNELCKLQVTKQNIQEINQQVIETCIKAGVELAQRVCMIEQGYIPAEKQ